MSVLTLDLKVYNYIRAAIERSAYRSTVDVWYNYAIRGHFRDRDIEKESGRLVRSWCDLNELSYNHKYNEDTDRPPVLSSFIRKDYTHKELTPEQVIKYLNCLIYNIELEHFEPSESQIYDFTLLKEICNDYKNALISSLPAYEAASWAD